MPLHFFCHRPKSIALGTITKTKTAHTFGGKAAKYEIKNPVAERRIHLIYRLDLKDPLLGPSQQQTRFLPLFYDYQSYEFAYQVVSDTGIEILESKYGLYPEPVWDVPKKFKKKSVTFKAVSYDPQDADDVMKWKGVFGWNELPKDERARALEIAKANSSLTEADGMGDEPWTYDEVIDCMYEPPFSQGTPVVSCRGCDSYMSVIAYLDSESKHEFIWPDEFVRTIWLSCESCGIIVAENQCT